MRNVHLEQKGCVTMSLSKVAVKSVTTKKTKKRTYDLTVDNEFIQKKHLEVANKNSKRSEKQAEVAFTQYLEAIDAQDFCFWDFEPEFLDDLLAKFWHAVRQTEKDDSGKAKNYKVQSLKTLRYSLNRVLKERGRRHDILLGEKFTASRSAFEDRCKELKALGLGYIDQKNEISSSGNENLSFPHAI